MKKGNAIEKLLWNIALPGFGQFLNGDFAKGLALILLEIIINVKANLNNIIILSYYGNIDQSIAQTDYIWLMFYPCLYMFAIWDAYKNAMEEVTSFSFLPFVLAAYLGTIGVVYAPTFKPLGLLLGPVWLPIIFMILGTLLGTVLKLLLTKNILQKT
jgi:magnesium-transporting ATPase (P-type)